MFTRATILSAVAGILLASANAQDDSCISTCSEWASYGGVTATGEASLKQIEGGTGGTLTVTLTDHELWNKPLVAHVHAAPCNEGMAGGHWKQDQDGPVDTTNEFWYMLPAAEMEGGMRTVTEANKNVTVPGPAGGAMSIVIHDANESASKMVCCDLSACESTEANNSAGQAVATFTTIAAAVLALLA